ncbi:MAG: hypothetical protein HYT90_03115 [Candidatus Omnitrophica bacterium]|nr:hypothetical protein [Candidatus Omnitrophota bacterium]
MRRPATWGSCQGLLLVEATLAAVVIAVGLAFISRGFASQLGAIRAVEAHEALLALAQGKLLELEAELLAGRPLPTDRAGTFDPPHEDYRWTLEAVLRADLTDEAGAPLASDVSLTVARDQARGTSLTVDAVWLNEWLD